MDRLSPMTHSSLLHWDGLFLLLKILPAIDINPHLVSLAGGRGGGPYYCLYHLKIKKNKNVVILKVIIVSPPKKSKKEKRKTEINERRYL